MMEGTQDGPHGAGIDALARRAEELPYRVELWQSDAAAVPRVLGRAGSMTLAQAIYKAAQTEHPGCRITLSHGGRLVADSAK